MSNILNFIKNEWYSLKKAPFTFITLFVLAFSLAYFVAQWYYNGIIQTLKERIEAKDDQVQEYRERLHLVPIDSTKYSKLTNEELRKKTFDLVSRIRDYISKKKEQSIKRLNSYHESIVSAKSEEERKREWNRQTKTLLENGLKTKSEYEEKFKVDSILLRDEILSRLPESYKNEQAYSLYEHPTNPIGMEIVVIDLERLSKSLP